MSGLGSTTQIATIPASIVDDCTADVTSSINQWITSVPNNSTLMFDSQGCYRVNGTVNVTDRTNVVLDGAGARFVSAWVPPRSPKLERAMVHVYGGTDITIRNLRLKGSNPTPAFDVAREWYPGINFDGVTGALVDNVTASNFWGDFVQIGADIRPGAGYRHSTQVTVRNSTATIIGRNQITCTACENVLVTNSTFTDTGYQVFDIEVDAPGWHASDISFTNNTIGGRIPLSVLVNAGIGEYIRDVTFTGNTMVTPPITCEAPIYFLNTEPVKSGLIVRNNTFLTLSAAARIFGVSDVTFADNTVKLVKGGGCEEPGTAVRAGGTTGTITGNDFAGFARILKAGQPLPPSEICGNRLAAGPYFDKPTVCAS